MPPLAEMCRKIKLNFIPEWWSEDPSSCPSPYPPQFIQQHECLHDHRPVHVTATYTHVLPHLSKAQDNGDWGSDSHSIVEGPCVTPRSLPPSGVGRTDPTSG